MNKACQEMKGLEMEHFPHFNASGRQKANDGWFTFAIELRKDLISFYSNLLFASLA